MRQEKPYQQNGGGKHTIKKELTYTLAVAMLLVSQTACGHKDTQQDTSQPDPATSTLVQVNSTPGSEPEPPTIPVPETLSSTAPEVPAENKDTQDQAEPAAQQEPAEPEPEQQTQSNDIPYTPPQAIDPGIDERYLDHADAMGGLHFSQEELAKGKEKMDKAYEAFTGEFP